MKIRALKAGNQIEPGTAPDQPGRAEKVRDKIMFTASEKQEL